MKSDIIVLTETWLEHTQNEDDQYKLTEYEANLNSIGRGKGIASYYKLKMQNVTNINCEGFSITKLEAENFDIIGVYRSQGGTLTSLMSHLETLIVDGKTTVIGGDFNVCALASPKNHLSETLRQKGFIQLVQKTTHIEGGLIDHVYLVQGENMRFSCILEDFPKYYSDHDGIGIILIEKDEE